MAKPAAYPQNDAAESASIALIEHLIDHALVKTAFAKRDKFPNIDGFLELVKKEGDSEIPVGKIDVQIKTMPLGDPKFQCPIELVEYAESVTTLPVILICADHAGGRAFWKHVHRGMSEFKSGQDSFVVKFDPLVDAIGPDKTYVRRWLEIVQEYRERAAGHVLLQQQVREQLGLDQIPTERVVHVQRFIDRINLLLDTELSIVKEIFFPGAWKLGVAINYIDEHNFSYYIYSVPFGSGGPLIVSLKNLKFETVFQSSRKAETDPLKMSGYGKHQLVEGRVEVTASIRDPVSAANDQVVERLEVLIKNRSLKICGRIMPTELLFEFMDRYAHATGLQVAAEYEVGALNYGLKVYFPVWYRLAVNRWIKDNPEISAPKARWPFFEEIGVGPTPEEVLVEIKADEVKSQPFLRSESFTPHSIIEAVDVLLESNVHTITRVHQPRAPIAGHISEGFPSGEAERRMQLIVDHAVREYEAFLKRNDLSLPRSRFVGAKTTTFYRIVSEPSKKWVRVERMVVPRRDGMARMEIGRSWVVDGGKVVIDGEAFEYLGSGWSDGMFLFQKTPMLNSIYAMLSEDVAFNYSRKEMHLGSFL